ncbi:MAG: DUF1501 domain-containing protein [Fimbriimonadaceae bacterium]
MKSAEHCDGYSSWLSRRSLLRAGALGAVSWMGMRSALADITVRKQTKNRDTLVIVFLRGGADGLNIVVPYADDNYHKARPSLRMSPPNSGPIGDRVLDLDGHFGFHPAMAPLLPLFKEGKLGLVHAVGSQDHTRSHFEAMSAMERGLERMGPGVQNGWLARYLAATDGNSPMRAVSIADVLPDSLKGGPNALNIREVAEFRLDGDQEFREAITSEYALAQDEMGRAGRTTLDVLKTLEKLDFQAYQSQGQTQYPDLELGRGMKQAAFLIKADIGLEIACLEMTGWDSHVAQGGSTGIHQRQQDDLARSLRAFSDDMGDRMKETTVIVMTEFGRRVYENQSLGTDHGRGSILFALGGNVKGGKIHGKFMGLDKANLEGDDVKVTTDYRAILAEALQKRMGFGETEKVFSQANLNPIGLFV